MFSAELIHPVAAIGLLTSRLLGSYSVWNRFGIANFKLGAIVTASSLRQGIYLRACEDVRLRMGMYLHGYHPSVPRSSTD